MIINDIEIDGLYKVFAVNIGQFIFDRLDPAVPGDIPPDVACLPVISTRWIRSDTRSVLHIDTVI